MGDDSEYVSLLVQTDFYLKDTTSTNLQNTHPYSKFVTENQMMTVSNTGTWSTTDWIATFIIKQIKIFTE